MFLRILAYAVLLHVLELNGILVVPTRIYVELGAIAAISVLCDMLRTFVRVETLNNSEDDNEL